jgi:hypothetical protein
MRFIVLAALIVTTVAQSTSTPSARVPVVVELFTSEGCSSCPPADAVLSKLAKEQPVAGVEIIPLGMHVTYWDQLGWRDPASLAMATERQQDYGRIFGEDRIYTPQAVVDGHEELIGSAEAGIRQAVIKAARQPHGPVSVTARIDGDSLKAEATIGLPPGLEPKLTARMLITEDGLTSIVKRGENGGRTLHHDAVVRAIFGGDLKAGRLLGFSASLNPAWRRDHLHVIVLVEDKSAHRIVGAGQTALK